jgi:short-subunit dehydrogenase
MSVLIISRSEEKLIEQENLIKSTLGGEVKHIAFDFTKSGPDKTLFYSKLDTILSEMHNSGGIGLLINNVGTANEHPKTLEEFTDSELDDMIQCNIQSTVNMTRAVLGYMKHRKSGCVVSISSGSGNWCSPFLVVYSATKSLKILIIFVDFL